MGSEFSRRGQPSTLHDFSGDMTREVIRAFYDVYNALPRGLLESAYGGALRRELLLREIPVEREVPLEVHYRGEAVGWYRADLIVDHRLILELKTMSRAGDRERRQLYHHLRITGTPLGLLLNFGVEPQILRVINSVEIREHAPKSR